jgi:hypothetical protein
MIIEHPSGLFSFHPKPWGVMRAKIVNLQEPLDQPYEPSSYHNPIQIWIEKSHGNVSWHNFVPPSHPHEIDSILGSILVVIRTHDCFMLDMFLLWFVIKHKGRILDLMKH